MRSTDEIDVSSLASQSKIKNEPDGGASWKLEGHQNDNNPPERNMNEILDWKYTGLITRPELLPSSLTGYNVLLEWQTSRTRKLSLNRAQKISDMQSAVRIWFVEGWDYVCVEIKSTVRCAGCGYVCRLPYSVTAVVASSILTFLLTLEWVIKTNCTMAF